MEDITFNLINKIDVASTEKKIRAYMEASQIGKSGKHSREYEASMIQESRLALDKEQADRRAENSRKKSASEAPKSKDLLADDTTGKKGTAGDRVTLKRSSGRRGVQGKQETDADSKTRSGAASDENGLIFRGLKVRAPESAPKSYDPFGDISFDNKFYTLKEQYDWKWLEEARVDPRYTVGGYRVQDYCSRALTEAFAGLGVFLDEEAANST